MARVDPRNVIGLIVVVLVTLVLTVLVIRSPDPSGTIELVGWAFMGLMALLLVVSLVAPVRRLVTAPPPKGFFAALGVPQVLGVVSTWSSGWWTASMAMAISLVAVAILWFRTRNLPGPA